MAERDIEQEITEINDELNEIERMESESEPMYFTEPILLSSDNLAEEVEFDKEEFNKGIKEASLLAGFYSALVSNGINDQDSVNLLFNFMNTNCNLAMAEINKEMAIRVAKESGILAEKGQL